MANWQRGVLRLMRVDNHPVQVSRICDYTPWYRRITFTAPELVQDLTIFPSLWLRLWVPNPSRGADFVSQRGYTFTDVDPEQGTFGLDFVLHDVAGPAGDWARAATEGEMREVALTPARPKIPDGTTRYVLAGDVTALPAINSFLEQVDQACSIQVWIEDDHDAQEQLPTAQHPNAEWNWVRPGGERGAALAGAISAAGTSPDGLYLWGAGERNLVKALRTVAKGDLGLGRQQHFTQAYWIEGKNAG